MLSKITLSLHMHFKGREAPLLRGSDYETEIDHKCLLGIKEDRFKETDDVYFFMLSKCWGDFPFNKKTTISLHKIKTSEICI